MAQQDINIEPSKKLEQMVHHDKQIKPDSAQQSARHSAGHSAEHSNDNSAEQSAEQSAGHSAEQSAGHSDEHSDEHSSNKISDKNTFEDAAIYLKEGLDNDKLDQYTTKWWYYIAHSTCYKIVDLVFSAVLLILALAEKTKVGTVPNDDIITLPVIVHGITEICVLTVLVFGVFVKIKWQGVKSFFTHRRSLFKVIVLCIMYVEAIAVLVRDENHVRVTRALRPLFLLDCRYFQGTRRALRHMIYCLPPILEMLLLLLFFMFIFTMLGFYLFSFNSKDMYFSTILKSLVSLFVLLTTANYPDVMMPSYATSRWSVIFFLAYISIACFLMSMLLAVVYESFTRIEKEKFKELFFHKRKAAEKAFSLLRQNVSSSPPASCSPKQCVSSSSPSMSSPDQCVSLSPSASSSSDQCDSHRISFKQFNAFMKIYESMCASAFSSCCLTQPLRKVLDYLSSVCCAKMKNASQLQDKLRNYLVFKSLLKNANEENLSLEGFYNIYERKDLVWRKLPEENVEWFHCMADKLRYIVLYYPLKGIHWIITKQCFELFIDIVVFVNGCVIFNDIIILSKIAEEKRMFQAIQYKWYGILFIAVYGAEAFLKLLGLGLKRYFLSGWNCFDFIITGLGFVGLIGAATNSPHFSFPFIICLRPLRLFRLFRLKQTYQDMFDAMVILTPRMFRVILVVVCLYYSFGIIGMECFAGLGLKHCCRNISVEKPFQDDGYYYLNNFDDLMHTTVTLFELTVVNNWFIIMEGVVQLTSEWSRLYFMIFYIITMVVTSIVISSIMEVFLFTILNNREQSPNNREQSPNNRKCLTFVKWFCGRSNKDSSAHMGVVTEVEISDQELRELDSSLGNENRASVKYEGKRQKIRMDLGIKMYQNEIKEWIDQEQLKRQEIPVQSKNCLWILILKCLPNCVTNQFSHGESTDQNGSGQQKTVPVQASLTSSVNIAYHTSSECLA